MVLHEEQAIKVLGEVEALETHMEVEDNLKEVMPPQDQAFYMELDPHQYPHQDPCLIQEDHKALEVAEHPHQAPQEEEPHPTLSRRTTRPWRWRWRTTTRSPQYRSQRRSPRPTRWTRKQPTQPPWTKRKSRRRWWQWRMWWRRWQWWRQWPRPSPRAT